MIKSVKDGDFYVTIINHIGGVFMKFYLMLAVLEYIVLFFITSGIDLLNYDYVNLKYSTFRFSNEDEENGLNILIKIFFQQFI